MLLSLRSFWRIFCSARRLLRCAWARIRVARIRLLFCMNSTARTLGSTVAIAIRALHPGRGLICLRRRIAWIVTDCRSPRIPESRSWIRRWPPLRHTPGRTSPNCRSTWCSTTGYTRPQACSARIATARPAMLFRQMQIADLRQQIRWPMCTAATISACSRVLPATGAKRSRKRISSRRPRTAPRATGDVWIDANS